MSTSRKPLCACDGTGGNGTLRQRARMAVCNTHRPRSALRRIVPTRDFPKPKERNTG
jgi:hypothetical protein